MNQWGTFERGSIAIQIWGKWSVYWNKNTLFVRMLLHWVVYSLLKSMKSNWRKCFMPLFLSFTTRLFLYVFLFYLLFCVSIFLIKLLTNAFLINASLMFNEAVSVWGILISFCDSGLTTEISSICAELQSPLGHWATVRTPFFYRMKVTGKHPLQKVPVTVYLAAFWISWYLFTFFLNIKDNGVRYNIIVIQLETLFLRKIVK